MSKPLDARQYRSSKGTIIRGFDGKIVFASGTTVPTDASADYSPGCIFLDTDGSAGSQFYINEGSATSCDFNALSQSASSFANATLTGNTSITGNTTISDAKNVVLNTTTGTQVGTAANQKLGVWGATPIIQPSGAGEAAGSGSLGSNGLGTVYVINTSTFNGNTGNKNYTINDIVKALKNSGIMAASG